MFSNITSQIFSHISLALLVLAILFSVFNRRNFAQKFSNLLFFLPVGVGGVCAFITHAFMPQVATGYASWYNSHFETQVALANLAFGLTGLISSFTSKQFKMAVATMVTVFLWGTAINSIQQLIHNANLTMDNLGLAFVSNILIPIFIWLSIIMTELMPNQADSQYRSL